MTILLFSRPLSKYGLNGGVRKSWDINLAGEHLMTKYLYTVKDKVTPHKF